MKSYFGWRRNDEEAIYLSTSPCIFNYFNFYREFTIKIFLSIGVISLMIIAKYKRSKIKQEEIEYDDRINANISKWSLRFMFFAKLLLVFVLIFFNQMLLNTLYLEFVVAYLLSTLFILFYIIPTIIKRY